MPGKKKSIIPFDREDMCYLCHSYKSYGNPMQVHHCLHGIYRKAADKYRLTVHLCVNCHVALHDRGVNDNSLERLAQRTFEKKYGHELFMQVFGKNWLDDEEKEDEDGRKDNDS